MSGLRLLRQRPAQLHASRLGHQHAQVGMGAHLDGVAAAALAAGALRRRAARTARRAPVPAPGRTGPGPTGPAAARRGRAGPAAAAACAAIQGAIAFMPASPAARTRRQHVCCQTCFARLAGVDAGEARRVGLGARARSPAATRRKNSTGCDSNLSGTRAPARRCGRHLGRQVEPQRQVGLRAAAAGSAGRLHPAVQLRQHRQVEAAPAALVGEGGVGEAVAQHHVAARQRRLDHLHAGGRAAPRTSAAPRSAGPWLVQHQRAQLFGQRRAAGLAGAA